VKGAINLVSTEKLVRGAYAIVEAYERVNKDEDWKKPATVKGAWNSKVDEDARRRYDPEVNGEVGYISRQVEDEVRQEMDRDAAIIKARSKIAERAKEK
jgi:hypothetical protein